MNLQRNQNLEARCEDDSISMSFTGNQNNLRMEHFVFFPRDHACQNVQGCNVPGIRLLDIARQKCRARVRLSKSSVRNDYKCHCVPCRMGLLIIKIIISTIAIHLKNVRPALIFLSMKTATKSYGNPNSATLFSASPSFVATDRQQAYLVPLLTTPSGAHNYKRRAQPIIIIIL